MSANSVTSGPRSARLRRTSRRVLPAFGAAAALLAATAAPGNAAAGTASFRRDAGGFHSVLAYGEGQTVNAADLAQNVALGTVPSTFTDQAGLYNAVVQGQPKTAADLGRYYKNSSFSVPSGGKVETPTPGATIVRDAQHKVPHIYADTRNAGMFAAGYATAEDRLFLMDVLRRTATGTTAELLGPSAVPDDSAALGQFDRSPEELTAEVERLPQDEGAAGARGLSDLKQYVAGINAYIAQTRTDPTKLPAEYPALGTTPRDWTLADTAAEAYLLIAQFTVAGDGEEKQADILARLQAKLGAVKGQQVFDDLRRLEDPAAPVTTSQRFPSDRPGAPAAGANARIDASSITKRDAVAATQSPGVPAVPPVAAWARDLAAHGLQLSHHASNALLVTAAHAAGGHALAAMGPQVGYYSPEILVEYELHMPGVHVSGMSFPGASPFPLIGHTQTFAWTGTTALGDNADTFAETLCNPDGSPATVKSDHYLYRGQCRAFTSRTQTLHTPLNPTDPTTPPSTVTLKTLRSVHGPVFGYATSGGHPVALTRSVAVIGRGLRSLVAFERLAENSVHSPQEFVATMRHFTGNENWFYVSSKHIAWLASGWFPQHARGVNVDLPMNGDGRHDWIGFNPSDGSFTRMPDSANPTEIDPKQGYLSSWNNKAAPGWHASPGTWSFGRVQRVELLEKPTKAAIDRGQRLTLPQLVGISGNASTQDLRGVEVLPDLLKALGPVGDPLQARLVRDLRAWVASGAHRRDTTGKGYDDNSAAILAFDAWWRQAVHAVYDRQIGPDLVKLVRDDEDLVLEQRAVETGFFDGWQSQLSSVVRAALGTRDADAPVATQCGDGTLSGCRAILRSSFADAVTALTKTYGADPSSWQKPVLCPKDAVPTCDENRPITAGAVATPAQPFENRGTYHQAVEIPVDLDAAAAASSGTAAPVAAGATLPTTGGEPLAALLAAALVAAGALGRRLVAARPG